MSSEKDNKVQSQALPQRKILYSLLFLSFLLSMNLWLGWEERNKIFAVVISVLSLALVLVYRIKLNFERRNIIFFLLLSVAYFYAMHIGIGIMIYLINFFVLICLSDEDKRACLRFITKWFGYLMIPCMFTYILANIYDLPSFGVQHATDKAWAYKIGYGECENYIFYMKSEFYNRFNGPFLEPGHVGMITAFLLFANQWDLKRKGTIFILLALLLSQSLAGYALGFISYMMILFYEDKLKLKYLFAVGLFMLVVYLFGTFYAGGDNPVNKWLLERLQPDEEHGFSGNNRVFGQIDLYFVMMFGHLHTLLFGYSAETMEQLAETGSRGTGFIMWMVSHGVIGTFLVALMYFVYAWSSTQRKYALLIFVFVVFMFWQRSYPFWHAWLICFLYGIVTEELRLKELEQQI